MRAYVRCCTYDICHNNGMHINTHTHTHTHIYTCYIYPLGWLSGNRVRFLSGGLRVRGPVHTKDHHTNGTYCLFAWHA